ncbi:MAG: hypothetical protein ABSB32_12720 [Thermodesulfobacteriota bacterium]
MPRIARTVAEGPPHPKDAEVLPDRRPCGDEAFVQELEGTFSRRLKVLSPGRPRKWK